MDTKRSAFHLQDFLRRFGILIYTGDPEGDRILLEDEVRDLKELGLIDNEEFVQAMMAIRKKYKREEE